MSMPLVSIGANGSVAAAELQAGVNRALDSVRGVAQPMHLEGPRALQIASNAEILDLHIKRVSMRTRSGLKITFKDLHFPMDACADGATLPVYLAVVLRPQPIADGSVVEVAVPRLDVTHEIPTDHDGVLNIGQWSSRGFAPKIVACDQLNGCEPMAEWLI